MKRVNIVVLTFFLVVMGFSLIPAGTGAWAFEEGLTPTAKSAAPVDPSLLMNLATNKQSRAIGDTIMVSVDSSGFPTILMTVSARNASGAPISNLTLNDFSVTEQSDLESAATVETIESFTESVEGAGVSLGLLFDLSSSMLFNERIGASKEDAVCLLDVMGSNDRAMLMSFSGPDSALEILPPGPVDEDADGNGLPDIIEEVDNLTTAKGYSTAIYDAMATAVNAMLAEPQPKAILLFTDGLSNNDQVYDINDAIQMATDANTPVATLIYGPESHQIENLAIGTGGVALHNPTCEDMNGLYNEITDGQTSIYTIIYTSHNPLEDGTTRTVEVMYDGTAGVATYAVGGGTPLPCTKNCGGGSGCFVQTVGGAVPSSPWTILSVLSAVLATGLIFFLGRRFSRKQNITILLAVSVLALSGIATDSARAGLRKGAISISPMAGIYYFDDDQEIEKDAVAGFGLGYQFAEHWGAELMLNYGRNDYHYLVADQCCCRTDDVSAILGRIDLLYHLWPEKNLVPYLAVGLGGIDLDFDHFDDEDDLFAGYGGGLQYFLSENIALRADVRGIRTFDESDNNLIATVGVSFLLGGKQKDGSVKDAAAPPVAPVAVAGEEGTTAPLAAMAARPADFQILFDFNKTDVNPAYDDNFKQVADYLAAYEKIVLRIEGHTDSIGPESYNQALSLQRAESVGRYLSVNFNVPQSRWYIIGFGESRPAADNATAEGRRLNRRAELQYLVPAEKPETADFDILFPFDKVDIKPAYDDKLKQVADYLTSYPEIILGIEGNADASGSESYNQKLSLHRAIGVGNYLSTQFHIPHSQLQYNGFGESNPVADNATLEGRQLNRRVELKCFKLAE